MEIKDIFENEYFLACGLLSSDRFVSFCADRGIRVTLAELEQLEKLGIFYPIARVSFPKIKIKGEYINDGKQFKSLGILKEEEKWEGDIREEYSHFSFEKKQALSWIEDEILWDPTNRPFRNWENLKDEAGYSKIESYYSIFQSYTLHQYFSWSTYSINAMWWVEYDNESVKRRSHEISKWAEMVIKSYQESDSAIGQLPIVCQVLSNRYYAQTQTDQRSIKISFNSMSPEKDWYTYCQKWKPKEILVQLNISAEKIKDLHETISLKTKWCDPLEKWYSLVNFVSVDKKRELKGKALLAQTLYSMEHMLRLYYEDLTGEKLYPPDESQDWTRAKLYGEGITENELSYLEFLANEYHVNPKPNLILIVEGEGECQEIPRLCQELFGYNFSKLGIEVFDLKGIGGFWAKQKVNPWGP